MDLKDAISANVSSMVRCNTTQHVYQKGEMIKMKFEHRDIIATYDVVVYVSAPQIDAAFESIVVKTSEDKPATIKRMFGFPEGEYGKTNTGTRTA